VKHIHTFDSFLNEQTLNEIGEGVSPFSWKRTGSNKVGTWMADMSKWERGSSSQNNRLPDLSYEFKSDNATYTVKILGWFNEHHYINFGQIKASATKPQDYNVSFAVSFGVEKGNNPNSEAITNFGEQFRVISTVSDIMQELMKELQQIQWIKVDEIWIMPKTELGEELTPIPQTKRGRLYLEYIKKQGGKLKGTWTAEIRKDAYVLHNGKVSSSTHPQNYIPL
jgi:hypothetical protein